jgi:hypothetical protein
MGFLTTISFLRAEGIVFQPISNFWHKFSYSFCKLDTFYSNAANIAYVCKMAKLKKCV